MGRFTVLGLDFSAGASGTTTSAPISEFPNGAVLVAASLQPSGANRAGAVAQIILLDSTGRAHELKRGRLTHSDPSGAVSWDGAMSVGSGERLYAIVSNPGRSALNVRLVARFEVE